jgi:hypothetical protein
LLAILCGQLAACASNQADATPGNCSITLKEQNTPVFLSSEAKGTTKWIQYPFTLYNNTSRELNLELQQVSCTCMEVLAESQGGPLTFGQSILMGANASCNFIAKVRIDERAELQKHHITMGYSASEGQKEKLVIPCEFCVLKDITASPSVLSYAWREGEEGGAVKLVNIVTRFRKTAARTQAIAPPICEQLPRHLTLKGITESGSSNPDDEIVEQHYSAEFVIARPELDSRISTDFCIIRAGRDPAAPAVRIPVTTEVVAGVVAVPPAVAFSSLTKGANDRSRRVLLKALDGQEFSILEIIHSCPNLTIDYQDKKASTSHWLDVKLDSVTSEKTEHEILVKTSHPLSRSVRIVVKQ